MLDFPFSIWTRGNAPNRPGLPIRTRPSPEVNPFSGLFGAARFGG
jgi:hypothetical protein